MRELLSPYLDGHLESSQQRKVEEHLGTCHACQTELESLRATVALLHLVPVVEPPRSFTLRSQVVARPRWQGMTVMRWSTALAAALLLVVLAGDGLTSFVLGGSPATAPLMAPEIAGVRAVAPAGETTGVEDSRTLRSQESAPRPEGTRLTPVPNKAGQIESAAPIVPQAAPSADSGSPPAITPKRDGEGDSGTFAGAQTTAASSQPGLSAIFRVVEIALASLVAILLLAGLFLRRRGGSR